MARRGGGGARASRGILDALAEHLQGDIKEAQDKGSMLPPLGSSVGHTSDVLVGAIHVW